ncbi:uncharacterized protein [Centruroides vittatus]|uniref:uncharacterized protein isoform X2 n=1 Tax=Centruroides vittatus TaxID=120091 RepID=UPI0035109DB8
MLSLFQQVFFGEENDSNDETDDWDDNDSGNESDATDLSYKTRNVFPVLTVEEAKQNADALIAEEEREKKRAEKRRAKKKKRKEKKKLQKERNGEINITEDAKCEEEKSVPNSSCSDTEGESIDPNSAFVAVAANKSKKLATATHLQKKNCKQNIFPSPLKQDRYSFLNSETCKKGKENKNKNTNQSACKGFKNGIDPNSAFVAVAASKSKRNISMQKLVNEDNFCNNIRQNNDVQNCREIETRVLRSRQVAIRGNEMAGVGHYQEAVKLFTEAIKLNPNDYRFFGNRSYCYDRLGLYERALKDSEKAISLAPNWAKGYFRKGRALCGLKKYSESEEAFDVVLKLDKNCTDAEQELYKVRTLQLMEMGFSKQQAETTINHYGNVQMALEALLSRSEIDSQAVGGGPEVYFSDNGSSRMPSIQDDKMDPRNPEGHTTIWVGNVRQDVTDKMLINLFTKFGDVISLRVLREKYCAFVNYTNKWSAGRAMKALQGYKLAGQNLVIRYPNNPLPPKAIVAITKKTKSGMS